MKNPNKKKNDCLTNEVFQNSMDALIQALQDDSGEGTPEE